MACDVMGPSEEPTVVLLNDHIAKLPSKYLCLHVFTVFFFLLPTSVTETSPFSGWWATTKFKTRKKFSIGKSEGSALDGTPILTCTLLRREHFLKRVNRKNVKAGKEEGCYGCCLLNKPRLLPIGGHSTCVYQHKT